MPAMVMEHDIDPREDLLKRLGNLDDVSVFNNHVLVAVYMRPQKTKSGIYLTDKTTDEDKYQSKVGVLVKMGPGAFQDPTGVWFDQAGVQTGDWLVYRPSDGWSITINNVLCRMMEDTSVKARIQHPDTVW